MTALFTVPGVAIGHSHPGPTSLIIGPTASASASRCVAIGPGAFADEDGMVAIGPLRIHANGRVEWPGDVPPEAITEAVREVADILRGLISANSS